MSKRKYTYLSTTNPEESPREKEHFARTRALAGECMVLLKNDGALPLTQPGKIALFGEGARNTVRGGTGSGMTITRRDYSVEDALEEAGFTVTTKAWLDRQDAQRKTEYDAFLKAAEENAVGGVALSLMGGAPPARETVPVTEEDVRCSETDTAIFVLARNAGEGDDRKDVPGDYRLAESEKAAMEVLAARYPKFILVLNVCGQVEGAALKEMEGVGAILLAGQQGAPGGLSIVDVLTGRQVPSGKLADTWAMRYSDYSTAPNFGLQEGNMDDVYYDEGVYVGYRYFDTFNVTPAWPFGFGLSYTDFSLACDAVSANAEQVSVTATVKNIGDRYPGREVVEIYVSAPDGALEKPYQELKAYGKTRLLQPGESETLTITFKTPALASYSEEKAAWVMEPGDYLIRVGNSSRDTHVAAVLRLDGEAMTWKLRNLFPDAEPRPEISRKGIAPYSYTDEAAEIAAAPVLTLAASGFKTVIAEYPEPQEWKDAHPGVVITAQDVRSGKYSVEELVAQLTVEEMAAFTTGNANGLATFFQNASQFKVPGSAAQSTDICLESRGIEEWICSDGPAGLHVDPEFVVYADGSKQTVPHTLTDAPFDHSRDAEITERHYMHCTAFPANSTVAFSWNPEVLAEISEMYAVEMKEIGMHTALKPSMNIHRDPLGGRNFEYYSEDPLLSGTYAAADVLALQKTPGITGTVKHFAVNHNERNRMHSNAHVHERALREIYLKNFEIAIRTAQPGCIMSSYNLINGTHAANLRDLQTDVCRHEWGYQGMIMTDWFMTETGIDVFSAVDREKPLRYGNTVPEHCTFAGNSIVMPGSDRDREEIARAVKEGRVALADLQRCAADVLRLILNSDVYEDAPSWYQVAGTEAPEVLVTRQ